jgi:hypothetical protein
MLYSAIVTIVIYSLPIMIYRYKILKKPVDSKKGVKITIIYGICAVGMSALFYILTHNIIAGLVILPWSYINYLMLTKGKDRTDMIYIEKNDFTEGEKAQYPDQSQEGFEAEQAGNAAADLPPLGSDAQETAGGHKADSKDDLSPDQPLVETSAAETKPESSENSSAASGGTEYLYCKKCGAKLLPDSVFCTKCRTNEYIVSDKTIKLLRMLYYVDISKISKLEISDKVKNEINFFVDEFYDKHTGLYLKSKQFLKKVSTI